MSSLVAQQTPEDLGVSPDSKTSATLTPSPRAALPRVEVRGKFLFAGDEKFFIRGVTYGPFCPREDGCEYPPLPMIERDMARMTECGINAIRTYTAPRRELLDVALKHGLRVLVGLPWEQHVTFLDDRAQATQIEWRVRDLTRGIAGHPAILAYSVGNEIPASIVRWYGARRVEAYIERLAYAVKEEDPAPLITYANFPPTEYLDLPFLDFACFNVYLESKDRLTAYLHRLQTLSGDRPLVLGELGFDSLRAGEQTQSGVLEWQIRHGFEAGSAGIFVFSWSDAWHRSGVEIEDWAFGLTRRDRSAKPALDATTQSFAQVPFQATTRVWPKVSVVVCTYNGSRTLNECLDGCAALDYPDYEVIVVDDGSTDSSAEIARRHSVRLISTKNSGLSHARNVGLDAASGEIVAYLDDDATPDRQWLAYLTATFAEDDYAGVGGPNLAPADDGLVAECVARSPGGPTHVLLTDREAEHIPGCNMAFRRDRLLAVGGFDPQFRIAGDDVDLCWRMQEKGWRLGFSPAAVVWHHRRSTVRGYLKQQVNYGKAEGMLERKWPEKYNAAGHLKWAGRLYGTGFLRALYPWRRRIYHGTWGTAAFQHRGDWDDGWLMSLPTLPEWYLMLIVLAGASALSVLWQPLLIAVPLLAIAIALPVIQVIARAIRTQRSCQPLGQRSCLKRTSLTAALHLLQPAGRLYGRLRFGLTPWRRRGGHRLAWIWPRTQSLWSETWSSQPERLHALEEALRARGAVATRGGSFDRWDLQVRGGLTGAARLLAAVEEHGHGRQMVRFHIWPRLSALALVLAGALAAAGVASALNQNAAVAILLGIASALVVLWGIVDASLATAVILSGITQPAGPKTEPAKSSEARLQLETEPDLLAPTSYAAK